MAATFAGDIAPKFRPKDIGCMTPHGIRLGDTAWMCSAAASFGFDDHGNARVVFAQLSEGSMPPDGAWPKDWVDTYQAWIDGGFQP
jgi:hypothetical protein